MRILKSILAVLFLLFSTSSFSQSEFAKMLMDTEKSPVDLSVIEGEILSPNSEYFYPAIYKRYMEGDTTLNLEDYRHLYFGYMNNEDYSPHKETVYVDSLSMLLNNDGAVFEDRSLMKTLGYMDKILEDRPFSLRFLNMMTYIYHEKVRDEAKALEYSYKFNMILSAIFSSGTGLTKDSPWMVLYRDDAQTLLSFIDAQVAKRTYITTNVEYYFLKERHGDVRGYYLDFDPIYTRPAEPKGKKKMEINPLHNPNSRKFINRN